jgi:conjugative transfer pilus assembly protein TraH
MRSRLLVPVLLSIGLAGWPTPGLCGWVDDWLTSRIESSPGYFAGQTRGYYTVGSFSARWPSTADYPVTVELPRFRVGCGGIDVFMGGFSFLDFDYLVTKLQNILSSAPAAAFDLALQALSPQAAQTVKDLEALADRLNAIQLDDCKTAQALVTVGSEALQGHERGVTNAVQQYLTESGMADFYQKTKEVIADGSGRMSGGAPETDAAVAGIQEGCPDALKEILRDGSVLQVLGADGLGLNTDFVALVRGFVGDIQVRGAGGGYLVSAEPPCPQNDGRRLDAVLEGAAWQMNQTFVCYAITDANANLRDYVHAQMQDVADAIRVKAPLTAGQQAFVNQSPLPLLHVLKAAVGAGQEAPVIASLADLAAKAYALQLLVDLYRRGEIILDTVTELLEKQRGPVAGEPPHRCAIQFVSERVAGDIALLRRRIRDQYEGLQRSYAAAAQELEAIYRVVEHLRGMEDQLRKEASSRVGQATAARTESPK